MSIEVNDLVKITGNSFSCKENLPVYIVLKKETVYFNKEYYKEYLLYSAETNRKFYWSWEKPYQRIIKI